RCVVDAAGEDPGRLAVPRRRRGHGLQRRGVALVLPPLPDPERVREVVRPDEEAVDAVERRDLARLRDCLRALDLDDADRLEALDVLTAARPVPAGAVQERD